MSTLTRAAIKQHLEKSGADRLVITPILSEKQFGDTSFDVRLGNQFIVFRMHMLGAFNPYLPAPVASLRKMQQRQIVRFGERFTLHPGMLALGATFEYVSMPPDLECQVEGRSSWARVGLQIATATAVEPGFKGVITLELSNVGTIPLELYPGVRIAQLLFRKAEPKVESSARGKYQFSIGPEFSRLQDDKDGRVFSGA